MAGSISLSLSQQFDELGRPLSDGRLYIYDSGTTTPQNAYEDSGLTNAHPWPVELDSAGRIPQLYFDDGSISIRLADRYDVTQIAADGVLVIGPSTTTGGGSTVDPATLLQTGWIQPIYGTGVVTGFVRLNGRSIGIGGSGATERANADTQALWVYLYNADANLAVSGGRSGVALTDYNAGKVLSLPDFRGKAIAGLDDMGSAPAGVLTPIHYGTDPTILGSASSAGQARSIGTTNLPAYTPAGSVGVALHAGAVATIPVANLTSVGGATDTNKISLKNNANADAGTLSVPLSTTFDTSFTGTAQGGLNTPLSIIQPTMVITIYCKL
jgi:hypothetical protein